MKGWSKELLAAVLLGALLGAGTAFSGPNMPVSLGVAALCFALVWASLGSLPEGDPHFVRKVFLLSVLGRAALALALHSFVQNSDALAGDDGGYELIGKMIAEYWRGDVEGASLFIKENAENFSLRATYSYWNAILFYLLGDVSLLPKLLNCILGALVPVYLYRIACRLYGERAGRFALVLSSIVPSMVLWSALNLRDAPSTFAITVAVYYTLRLKEGFSPRYLLFLGAAMLVVAMLRSYMFLILSAALVLSFIGLKPGRGWKSLAAGLLTAVLLLYLSSRLGLGESSNVQEASFARLNAMRRGLATGGSAYAVDVDISSPGKALMFLPIGILYILFAPFPWQLTSFRQLLAFPEVLGFYFLFPYIVRGVRDTIKTQLGQSLPVLLPAVLVTICYALVEGNVGTAYRHKSQILGLFFVLAARDLAQKFPFAFTEARR